MRRLVVQITDDDAERAATAFNVAMATAASGFAVHIWLSGPATMFAVPGREPDYELEFAPEIAEALGSVVSVSVCTQCAQRRGLTQADLREGVSIAGAAKLAEMLMAEGTQALTY